MNIEKEREAFEKAFKLKWKIGHLLLDMVVFNHKSNDYHPINEVKDRSDEFYWILGINTGWWAWIEAQKLEGCVVVNTESLLLHAQSIRMFNDGDMENHSEEIEEHVCAIEEIVEAARGGK